MPTPLHLSDEEMDVLLGLAAPIAFDKRQEFLQQVATKLAACPHRGPGALHQIAARLQRGFTLTSQRETSLAAAPRHLRARQAAR